ncbi:MAG: recombination protein RmuC [Actinomycetota bacterium]|jgi:DNA recombination protein RmuC
MEIIYLALGLLVGTLIGWLIAKLLKKSAPVSENAIETAAMLAAKTEAVTRLETQVAELKAQADKDAQNNLLAAEIKPVKESLAAMTQTVADLQRQRTAQVGELQEQIRSVVESNENIRKEAAALSQAMSSNSVRGVWGEAQLRRLVELAGLLKHADFDEQATISTGESSGRADMIIRLPGGKSLAIDSKVPFNSYQAASAISELATGEEALRRKKLLEEHVKAMKGHIDALSTRSYWTGLEASPDFVIAFVPSESLLSAALDLDNTLLEYAFKKNVALASPVSLFSVLKTINYIWRQNADEGSLRTMIALGKELYERVGKVTELADKLGRSIGTTVKDYNAFVSSFERRMLVTARKLNDLDENELSTSELPQPKEIESSPDNFTASEAIIEAEIVEDGPDSETKK